MDERPLVSVRNLVKQFRQRHPGEFRTRTVTAVNDVSFSIRRDSIFGLVGESGSGKTTLARCMLFLDPPTSGEVLLEDQSLGRLSAPRLREARRRMQIVFQDPHSALNPRMSAGRSIEEGMENSGVPPRERRERVRELADLTSLPRDLLERYPHELSGGQKQRVVIARALAVEPEFLILDEPVSSLDVSIQARIINLLLSIRERLGLTYLFISHDLDLISYLSDEIAVMRSGEIVEIGPAGRILSAPEHPYTRSLYAAMPGRRGSPGLLPDAPTET